MDDTGHERASHAHSHAGDHGHAHATVREDTDRRRLTIGLVLIVGFMVVEVAAGIVANSLALLSDAAHMLTDAGALLLALVVLRLVRRPAGGNLTFGFQRMEALSAQANGATLLVLAGLIVYGGIKHLVSPPESDGLTILVVSLAGIVVMGLASHQLAKANRDSMNIEGAFQHIWTDMIAFVATAAAGAVILATGYYRADAIAALFVAAIMVRASIRLLRASGRVLLEIAPAHLDVAEVGRAMATHARVTEVHDLHVWEISTGFAALSAHILVEPDADCHGIRRELEALLEERFGVDHTTLQVDHAPAEGLLQIGRGEPEAGRPATRH